MDSHNNSGPKAGSIIHSSGTPVTAPRNGNTHQGCRHRLPNGFCTRSQRQCPSLQMLSSKTN
jgi:hypothetical protein